MTGEYRRYRVPFAVFGGIWLGAVAFLAARGLWVWVGRAAGAAAAVALLIALTFRLTNGRPMPSESRDPTMGSRADARARGIGHPPGSAGPRRLAVQLAVALAFAVLAAARFAGIPVWSGILEVLYAMGRRLPVPHALYLVNPVLYVVLPGAAVLALGAGWREIGFREGWRPWRVIAAWSAPVVAVWAYSLATGQATVIAVIRTVLSNTFQNGFGEEFLWRGLIQTRLARLWTPEWGLVLASLGFGWWHIDSIHDWAGNDLLLAAALNVVVQAPMGLALGVIFDRTRNLLAPSVVHIVANSVDL